MSKIKHCLYRSLKWKVAKNKQKNPLLNLRIWSSFAYKYHNCICIEHKLFQTLHKNYHIPSKNKQTAGAGNWLSLYIKIFNHIKFTIICFGRVDGILWIWETIPLNLLQSIFALLSIANMKKAWVKKASVLAAQVAWISRGEILRCS